jgi:hypothetical protein
LRGKPAPRRFSYETIFSEKTVPANGCERRYAGICAVVIGRIGSGYVSRCLLCGEVGPARSTAENARHAFLEGQGRDKR